MLTVRTITSSYMQKNDSIFKETCAYQLENKHFKGSTSNSSKREKKNKKKEINDMRERERNARNREEYSILRKDFRKKCK